MIDRPFYIDRFSVDPEELGRKRNQLHLKAGSKNKRFFKNKDWEHIIGAYGEVAFADCFRLPLDQSLRPQGDITDFTTEFGRIDVKTSTVANDLEVKVSHLHRSELFVLAWFIKSDKAVQLLGWEHVSVVAAAPKRMSRFNFEVHFIPAEQLRPMDFLGDLLK